MRKVIKLFIIGGFAVCTTFIVPFVRDHSESDQHATVVWRRPTSRIPGQPSLVAKLAYAIKSDNEQDLNFLLSQIDEMKRAALLAEAGTIIDLAEAMRIPGNVLWADATSTINAATNTQLDDAYDLMNLEERDLGLLAQLRRRASAAGHYGLSIPAYMSYQVPKAVGWGAQKLWDATKGVYWEIAPYFIGESIIETAPILGMEILDKMERALPSQPENR